MQAGQTLLQLDAQRHEARRAQIAAQQAQAAARLAELRRGPRAEEIDEARARLRGEASDLANAERELQRLTGLIERKLASQEAVDNARTLRDRARASRDVSRAALQVLLAGTTVEELRQAEAQLAQAEAQLRGADLDLERLTLRARVTPGIRARVYVDGIDAPFKGRVRMASSEAVFTPYFSLTQQDRSRLSYVTEVVLADAAAAALPGGAPVRVEFVVAPPATDGDGR